MGIYDRTYYRDDESGSLLKGRSVVLVLLVTNVALFFLQSLLHTAAIPTALLLSSDFFQAPWQLWRLVTYSFVHLDVWEIIWNMLGLYFFGKPIEEIYGPREFIRIYFMLVLVSALTWLAADASTGLPGFYEGAFGAVTGLLILFCLHNPKASVIFIFVPMPAWVLGAIFIGIEVIGLVSGGQRWITAAAHLAGGFVAFLYFHFGWNLGRFVPSHWPRLRRPTKLRLHDPEAEERQLARQVDAILEKISRDGEASLTKQERRTLEQASRRYQRRRQ